MLNRLRDLKYKIQRLKMQFNYEITRGELGDNIIALIPEWSTLKTLGQSKIISLTIIAPLLGSVLILNEHVADLLQVPAGLINRHVEHDIAIKSFSLDRLYMIYFGLVFVGFASGIFQITCPSSIKSYKGVSDYIEGEQPLVTNARRDLLVLEVSDDHINNHDGIQEQTQSFFQKAAYPRKLSILFHTVYEEIAELTEGGMHEEDEKFRKDNPDLPVSEGEEVDPDPFGIRIGIRSSVDSSKVAEIITMRRAVERAFWLSFIHQAQHHLTDILSLRYMAMNNSRPFFRILISMLYLIGFAALLKPTVQTFFLVSF